MNKKRLLTILAVATFAAPTFSTLSVEASSQRMRDLQQQQEELNRKSNEVDGEISAREQRMQELENEKSTLEAEVAELQLDIDDLVTRIDEQEKEIKRIEKEIERLQEEIEMLIEQINRRNEKLESQARSVQTQANPADIVDLMLNADSLSDLIGRIGVVSQLVSANQNIMQAQLDDQQELEETEAQVVSEQEEMEKVKAQMESDRATLLTQRETLDAKIIEIAERYNMTEDERNSFINEQNLIAERSSNLSEEMRVEQQRIIEAERKRQEELRLAEEQRQREAEAQARAEAAAEAKARAAAEAERQEQESQTSSSNNESSNSGSNTPSQSNSGWIRPASGRLTSGFGYRIHPVHGTRRLHSGIDIAGGGPIRAARAGTVTTATYHHSLGYYVVVDHGGGYASLYAHMTPNLTVSRGQQVSQGQQLGIMGTTGTSTGVHLHFEIHKNGRPVNPAPYVGM